MCAKIANDAKGTLENQLILFLGNLEVKVCGAQVFNIFIEID